MENPYNAPTSNPQGRETFAAAGHGGVTRGVVEQLARTKGWVRFFGVIGIIFGGLTILGAVLAVFLAMSVQHNLESKMPDGPKFGTVAAIGIVIVYGAMGAFMLYPSIKLNSYASAIGRLIYSGKVGDLEAAIEQQRAYWKFVGIVLVFLLLIVALSLIITIAGASQLSH